MLESNAANVHLVKEIIASLFSILSTEGKSRKMIKAANEILLYFAYTAK